LITEPYLGGGGSYHPPRAYLQSLVEYCRRHEIDFILDEVQSNFGRTGSMYAFETYEIEPDLVVLGKGMGNGVPVNAVVGRRDLLDASGYGAASDTWSGHQLGCAATLATLDLFESTDVLEHARLVGARIERGLRNLKELPVVAYARGECCVWGIEFGDFGGRSSNENAIEFVKSAYLGDPAQRSRRTDRSSRPNLGGKSTDHVDRSRDGIHLLGPLAGNVVRLAPPLTIDLELVDRAMLMLFRAAERTCG
jgi:4-aminobutyrate aminotransferase-like enzyme